jgi:hypothetical protein
LSRVGCSSVGTAKLRCQLTLDGYPGGQIPPRTAARYSNPCFRTGGHLSSWAGKTPLDHQSGKRAGRARHKKGNKYLAAVTGETAVAAGKTATREGARYRKLARSRGKGKAQVAVGNTQLRVYHKLLSNPGMRYQDLGPGYYERQAATRRKIAYHVREIQALGLEVTLARIPEPDPGGPATTQAA